MQKPLAWQGVAAVVGFFMLLLLRLSMLPLLFVCLGCATTPKSQTLLIVKPKDSIVGLVQSEDPSPIQVLFPAAEAPEERSLGLIVTSDADRPRLLDGFSEFAIAGVEKNLRGMTVHLRYARDFRSKEFMGDVVEANLLISGILGNRSCKSIFLRQYAVHITNNHCLATASTCRDAFVNDKVRCSRILYTNALYDLTVFTTESNAIAISAQGPRTLRADCHPSAKINTFIAEDGSFKIAGMLGPCAGTIAQSDAGSPLIAADDKFVGMIGGPIDLPNGKQAIRYTPAAYIQSVVGKIPHAH